MKLTTAIAIVLCFCMLIPCFSASAVYMGKDEETKALLDTPEISTSKYSYNGYTTWTMNEASLLSIHSDKYAGGTNCTSMQGMNVGTTYIYTAKRNSNDTYCTIARTTASTGAITFMNYYSSTSATSSSGCNTAGHANDLLVVTTDNVNYMLAATGITGKSMSMMKISGTNLYFTGYFDTVNTNGSSISVSSVRQYKHTGGYYYLLIKNGETFYYCKIADTDFGGTASNPSKITCYKLFTIDKRNAIFAKSNSSAGTYANMETWVNQGFTYNPVEKTIYVPMFKPTTGNLDTNVILTYYVGDVLTDARMDFATNKTDLVVPTKTSFWLEASDYSSSCYVLEVESVGFRTGQGTDGDLRMYINANAAPVASFEGVYSMSYTSGSGDFTPIVGDDAVIYTVKYDANGGTDSGTNSSYGNYKMNSTIHIRGISNNLRPNYFTRSGYTFEGWYLNRKSDGKWLYFDADGTARWYLKGSQPKNSVLALYEDKRTVAYLTSVDDDVITCYAQWKPNSTGTTSFYIQYDGNGGTGTMADTKVVYGTSTTISTNAFTRDGYVFSGWSAYRRNNAQWCYKTVNAETVTDTWETVDADVSNYMLKTYSDGCSLAKTTATDRDIVTFYAAWSRVKDGVYPTSHVTGTAFSLGGTVESTTDMYSVAVNVKNSAGTVVATKTANPYGNTFSMANANIDFSTLAVGNYTLEVVAGFLNGSSPTLVTLLTHSFEVVNPAKLELTDEAITNGSYALGDSYFKGFSAGNSASALKKLFKYEITVTDANGNTVEDSAIIGTGWTIACGEDNRKTVLTGDLNGDAIISSADLLVINAHITGSTLMTDIYKTAADSNGDGAADATDSMVLEAKLSA